MWTVASLRRSLNDLEQPPLERRKHPGQFMAPLQHRAMLANQGKGALLRPKLRALLDPDFRPFRAAPKSRKACHLFLERHGVIAPMPGGDHPSVQVEDVLKFAAIEGGDGPPITWPGKRCDDAQARFTCTT